MNKTITSNIAGYVFHIDENAFDKLDAYLNTIRSYFNDSQGKDEIIADIEARLAEMLQERIGDAKQVVTLDDVNHVIQIMGRPEAFLEDDPDTAEWTEQKTSAASDGPKRLFRDPDNRVGAGICAGVSHYLGLGDPIWLRLLFVLALFLSFGTALIIYVVLYLIIPEAVTSTDKLQMRGESVTVSNIEKKVNEELETVKAKWNHVNNNGAGQKIGDSVHRIFTLLITIFTGVFKIIGKIIGVAFLMVGAITFLSTLTVPLGLPTMISLGNDGIISSFEVQDIIKNVVGGTGMVWWIYLCIILTSGLPFLALAFLGIRLLFGRKTRVKGVGVSLILVWIVGVVMSFGVTMVILSDFTSEGTDSEIVELALDTDLDQVIHLSLNHEMGEDEPTVEAEVFGLELITSGSTRFYGKPELDINLAKTGGPRLLIKRLAHAKKKLDAVDRARKIEYGMATTDTSVLFNGFFEIPQDEPWRTQAVEIELLLPAGYTIYLDDELGRIIYDIDNLTDTYDRDMLGRKWTMTPYGLACVDCEGLKDDEEIESVEEFLEKELEEKQRLLEMEQERLEREMEKRQHELERIEEELEREMEASEESEEASSNHQEILLKRVINASYRLNPTTLKQITFSYPG